MRLGILAFALFIGTAVFAQDKGQGHDKHGDHAKKEHKTAEERATNITNKMTTQLGLDDAQKAKIYDINYGIAKKNDALRADSTLTKDQRMTQMRANHDARVAMYKDVLTPEQFAKYEAWEKEKRAKMEARKAEKKEEKSTKKPAKGGKGGAKKGTSTTPEPTETNEEEEL